MSRFPPVGRLVRRQRGRQVALAALVTLAAVILAVLVARPSGLKGGPVYAGGGRNAQPIDVGVPYSFGYLLRTEGKQPAVLERVRVLDVTGPIEVLGVMARPHPSGPKPYFFALAFGFPPPDYPSKPLAEEHVVPLGRTFSEGGTPNEGLQLVVGVKSTGPGIGRIHGIEFTYRVGKRRYRNSYDGSGFLCAPASEYSNGAPKSDECLGPRATYTWDKKFVDFHAPTGK